MEASKIIEFKVVRATQKAIAQTLSYMGDTPVSVKMDLPEIFLKDRAESKAQA